MYRRQFIHSAFALTAVSLSHPPILASSGSFKNYRSNTYFTINQKNNHWWFIAPDGKPFFSLGLNHIDPASLRYPENIHIWRDRYHGSTINWLKHSVAPNLKQWGFNTIGWEQEVSVRQWPHSRSFTAEEHQAHNLPYCHMLPFMESHQWQQHVRHYDFASSEWEEWCDYIARAHCAELSTDQNLVGYFYSDCPTWIHTRPANEWRGPIFDPEMLNSAAGKKALQALAQRYYKITHDAIRRYDKNHLILGDRYEANAPLPQEVVSSALPWIDVLCFQDFRDPVNHLDYWHRQTNKPVLLADAAKIKWQTEPGEFTRNNGQWYADTLAQLHKNPGCVGFHLCGAYQRNKARRYGLLDEQENPDRENIQLITAANQKVNQWMKENFN